MYLDIPANDNIGDAVIATFKETGATRPLRAVRLWRDGAWRWCAITGWDDSGAVPALVTPIEESGDGPALLIHGGAHGVRLAAVDDDGHAAPRWALDDATQWGEAFLLCRPTTELVSH